MSKPFEHINQWEDFNDECRLVFDAMPDSPTKRRALILLGLSDALLGYVAGSIEIYAEGNSALSRGEQAMAISECEVVTLLVVNALLLHPDDPALELETRTETPPLEVQRNVRFGAAQDNNPEEEN